MIRLKPGDSNNLTVAVWDADAELYEIFADNDCDAYIGCADTVDEAKVIAADWIADESDWITDDR